MPVAAKTIAETRLQETRVFRSQLEVVMRFARAGLSTSPRKAGIYTEVSLQRYKTPGSQENPTIPQPVLCDE